MGVRCNEWVESLLDAGIGVAIAEIADYEVRRELVCGGKVRGLERLDRLKSGLLYVPLTTGAMLLAAECWAQARNAGQPTADPKELDADAILAAQAAVLASDLGEETVIATTNVGHLAQFWAARLWRDIEP